ncbi:MAG: PrsW family intramembrane metalloprotease [Anaerolineae bacterium]|nr:MAG: PrsW family intramembrane metalloprotease [Anaerolineae bacterium]
MIEQICCVCHRPVGPDAPRLGGRFYCEAHYAKVTRDRGSIWASGLVQIVGLLVFVGLVALIVSRTGLVLDGAALVWAGVVLAVVPALLWLAFFYQRDRLEPEPKQFVLGVFLLGALLASAVGMPVVRDLFQVREWMSRSVAANILGSILVVGFVQEFLKYAAVRYSVYLSAEFDERIDGVIYGTAAGLGFATMLNIHYVTANAGVDLGVGVVRIAVTALAQASFAGISGYFLGRAKFEQEPVWWLPLGVTIAAALNGLFTFVRAEIVTVGLSYKPVYGLVLAAAVALVTFVVLNVLMRRANRLTLTAGSAG